MNHELTVAEQDELKAARKRGIIDILAFWAKWREEHETPADKSRRLQEEFSRNARGGVWYESSNTAAPSN